MGRTLVRLVALVVVALCATTSGASALAAEGAQTIAQAPGVKSGTVMRGRLFDGAFYSGYSVAYWTVPFLKGDRISMRTAAAHGETPPCQLLFMPGTDDTNVGATSPILESASATRHGSRDAQTWVATNTGTYVLAMTNADVFLSGPHQCLSAPSGRPFTFKVTVVHRGGGDHPGRSGGPGDGAAEQSSEVSTHVVEPGQSLWVIAKGLIGEPDSIAQVAFEVGRLWHLNAETIGTGDPDLIYPGLKLRLR
jgi:nucleoid-associated protein YgaU